MKINDYLRLLSGFFIMVAVLLSKIHSPQWIWFILFIGANLFQSAFTKWCPAITLLRKLKVKE